MCHPKAAKGFGFGSWPHDHESFGHGIFNYGLHRLRHKFLHGMRGFMPYSVEATDTQYIIRMPLPGWDVKEVKVSVKKNRVLIETVAKEEEMKEDQPQKKRGFAEFLWNKPQVDIIIPLEDEIEPDTVDAKLSKGILTVTVARRPGTKIDVEE